MPDPAPIRPIIVMPTVIPVGPLRATIEEQDFALTISVAYQKQDQDETAKEVSDELLPWTTSFWERLGLLDQIIMAARPIDDDHSDPISILITSLKPEKTERTPKLAANVGEWVQHWIKNHSTIVTFDPLGHPGPTGPDAPKHRLAQDLAYVATLPGETSVALGLVHYFKIPPDEHGNSYFKAATSYQMVAAPMSSENDVTDLKTGQVVKTAKLTVKNKAFRFWEPVEHEKQKIERWKLGWEYSEKGAVARSINKPLQVSMAKGVLQFGPPHLATAPDAVGPDFTTYWFKIREASSWSNGIERRFLKATDAFAMLLSVRALVSARLTSVTTAISHAPIEGQTKLVPEKLKRLKQVSADLNLLCLTAMAFHSQWRMGFELQLLPPVKKISGIPGWGENLIIVATVDKVLHFRIFDSHGNFVDTDETSLAGQAGQLEDLRRQYHKLCRPHVLTWSEKVRIITRAKSILGHIWRIEPELTYCTDADDALAAFASEHFTESQIQELNNRLKALFKDLRNNDGNMSLQTWLNVFGLAFKDPSFSVLGPVAGDVDKVRFIIEKMATDLSADHPQFWPRMLFLQWDYAIHAYANLLPGSQDDLLTKWTSIQEDPSFKKAFGLGDFVNWGFGPGAVHHRLSVDLARGALTVDLARGALTVDHPSFRTPQQAANLMVRWLALPSVNATSFTSLLASGLPRLLRSQITEPLNASLSPVPPARPSEQIASLSEQIARLFDVHPWDTDTVQFNLVAPIWADIPGVVPRSGQVPRALMSRREKKPVGLTVQIDELDSYYGNSASVADDDDPWRNIAGAVLMLRRQPKSEEPATDWRIATAAHVVWAENETAMFDKPCVLPIRMPYRAGMRYPFLNYNQKSLVAPNPLEQAIPGAINALPHLKNGEPAQYVYETVLEKKYDHLRLTRLKYGVTYEVAACLLDVAGGLPDELTTPGKPWAFKDDLTGLVPKQIAAIPILYRREVSVGHVRVSALQDATTKKPTAWRGVPDGVAPMARELPFDSLPIGAMPPPLAGRRTAEIARDTAKRPPFLLLTQPVNGANTAVFGVKPPSVDIDVFERWVPEDSQEQKDELKSVWVDYLTRLQARNYQPPSFAEDGYNPQAELAPDDPAVSLILIRLELWDWVAWGWKVANNRFYVLPPTKPGLSGHQRDWLVVRCGNTGNGTPSLHVDHNGVKVGVPNRLQGSSSTDPDLAHVARLSFYAVVGKQPDADRFRTEIFEPPGGDDPDFSVLVSDEERATFPASIETSAGDSQEIANYKVLAPSRVLLETPSPLLPVPAVLWGGLSLASEPRTDGDLPITLAVPTGGNLRPPLGGRPRSATSEPAS